MKNKFFTHEICVCALLDTNSDALKNSAEMGITMTKKEAMKQRHTVRKYQDKKLPADIINAFNTRIGELNAAYGLNMTLITEDTTAFNNLLKIMLAKGVRNYLVLAGKDVPETDEKLGYCSADIMLEAQTLGLNSWWVGATFSKGKVAEKTGIRTGDKIIGIVVLGYGAEQGKPHKSKSVSDVSDYKGETPPWFQNGVQAALLAPTALNHQNFTLSGKGNQVHISCDNGIFSGADLGIVKYHFELGAGKENFNWI